jgi:hypothetical protein
VKDGPFERLAGTILSENERKLAKHLAALLGNRKYDTRPLIAEILPRDWESNRKHTLKPREVYRPFLYLRMRCNDRPPETRYLIHLTGLHLEGCLKWLAQSTPEFPAKLLSQPFGGLVIQLRKQGTLHATLAKDLLEFNSIVNVPAKHIIATTISPELDKRTFSVLDVSLAFVMMRKLSMQLFDILRSRGVAVPQEWKTFNENWLSMKPLVPRIATS